MAKGYIILKGIEVEDVDDLIIDDAPAPDMQLDEGYYYITNPKTGQKIGPVRVDAEKVTKVKFSELKEKTPAAKKPSKGTKVEAAVTTGIKVTSEPDQLVIYFNKAETQWRTPETLNLAPGIYVIGVEGNITGDGPVEVKANEVTPIHITV